MGMKPPRQLGKQIVSKTVNLTCYLNGTPEEAEGKAQKGGARLANGNWGDRVSR